MPIPLYKYAKLKDKYCFSYFGPCNEYVLLLNYIIDKLKEKFDGTNVFIACNDSIKPIFNEDYVIPKSSFNKQDYGYVKNIRCDMKSHPIEKIIKECGINLSKVETLKTKSKKCVIYTNGMLPTKNLNPKEIQFLTNYFTGKGWDVCINQDNEDAGLVVGVENMSFFQAAINGINTILIPTGLGNNLYQSLFHGQIFKENFQK